ncbi:hypothetical protein AX15_001075 [Amanita polypyramis BW_CC]|nr:hypothetical protein AX15_001075 [Amanita polypyramis BW_CC]
MYRYFFRTHPRAWARTSYRRNLAFAAAMSSGTLYFGLTKLHADSNEPSYLSTKTPFSSFVRAYTVYSMCSIPFLVDYSPQILRVLTSVPVVRQITEAFVRATFFNQFVGGDSARDTIPLLHTLRAGNKGTLLAYSVEVDDHTAASSNRSADGAYKTNVYYKHFVDEMIQSIDAAADFEDSLGTNSRRTWIAIKLTPLLPDTNSLINLSRHIVKSRSSCGTPAILFPGSPSPSDLEVLYAPRQSSDLTQKDINSLRELHADLERICTRAKERGVKVIIDAEYSWCQPAIDAFQLTLMRKFNALDSASGDTQPLIYGTWQAYLRRTPAYLAEALWDAQKHNYSLGVKLVRGAYHTYEVAAHRAEGQQLTSPSISPDLEPPVWMTKLETDACYNASVRILVEAIAADIGTNDAEGRRRTKSWWTILKDNREITPHAPRIGVLFGTHNWNSCNVVLEELVKMNLATEEEVQGSQEKDSKAMVSIPYETVHRVAIAQLYGMCDDLTDSLVDRTRSKIPFIMK